MKTCLTTALAALLLLPAALVAQEPIDGRASDVDEIRVTGRSVTTGLAQIEVDREILVDTATALKDIPGANVNANGPVTGIAQYRGMFGDRISVVIDHLGVVSGGPNAMDAPLSYLSPMITENLSVVRGIPSVSLAPESIGGHVSTALSRGDFSIAGPALSGFVGSRYSANGNVSTSASRLTLAGNTHKLSLVAELDEGDSVSTPVGENRPTRLHRERSDLSYAFAGDRTSVLLFAGRLDTDDTGTPALPMDIRFIDTMLAGAQATLELNENVSLEARVAWNDVEHLMDNFGLRQAPMPPMQRQNFSTGSGTQASLATTVALSGSTLILGIDTSTADHDATITNPNNAMFRVDNFVDANRDVFSVFAEWKRDAGLGDIEVGLRARRVETGAGEVFAVGMMGDMGANAALLADAFNAADRSKRWSTVDAVLKYRWQIDSGTEWRFELGSKTRAPSYQELYLWLPLQATGGLADGRSYIGGLDLDEERSNEITIGFGRTIGRFAISPQLFFKRIDEYIQGVPSTNMVANMVSQMMSGSPALQFSNVNAEIYGADIAWQVELSEQWSLDGVASWTRGKRRDISDNLYRLAPPNASIGLLWENDRLSIASELVAYSEQDNVSIFNGEQRTPGYALINATLNWTPTDALRIEARLDNLSDKTYQDHLAGINRAGGSDIPVGVRLYGAERTLSAGVIWSF
ncbi:MAG: TonB-dependent receptor [Gammaproteobacteria bacterium]|nr:TonB-dependent receptor [Gammaproteobacteria bacterium]MBT8109324.1 TonB-dependent receptor [Gammaproteobacteria bacterium]NNL44026.1 TonB-dependent receptor [Woeseiaceae bacterium]